MEFFPIIYTFGLTHRRSLPFYVYFVLPLEIDSNIGKRSNAPLFVLKLKCFWVSPHTLIKHTFFQAFSSWLNSFLEKRDMAISNIQTDLDDGVRLLNFLELLSGKKVHQKYDPKPHSRIQKISNLHIAITFHDKELGIKSNASAEGMHFNIT